MSIVECSNNHIDDDLQCLCWLMKIRPTNNSNRSLSSNTDDIPLSQQSFIFIRLSNGKISCLSIRHFV